MEPNRTPGHLPAEFLPPLGGAANIADASRRGSRLSVSVKDQSLTDPTLWQHCRVWRAARYETAVCGSN